jgi:hypothetical protein
VCELGRGVFSFLGFIAGAFAIDLSILGVDIFLTQSGSPSVWSGGFLSFAARVGPRKPTTPIGWGGGFRIGGFGFRIGFQMVSKRAILYLERGPFGFQMVYERFPNEAGKRDLVSGLVSKALFRPFNRHLSRPSFSKSPGFFVSALWMAWRLGFSPDRSP